MKIHPSASVYQLVQNTDEDRSEIRDLYAMLRISHEIENAIIIDGIRARVFSGFQNMSAFLPQVERYKKLAQKAESVYVFGHMDIQPPAILNVRYVPLEQNDQLIKEWFLVADAPNYFTALVTEEVNTGTPGKRQFQGIWSFDEEMVTILQSWLSNLVGAKPLEISPEKRNYQNQASITSRMVNRLAQSLAKAKAKTSAG